MSPRERLRLRIDRWRRRALTDAVMACTRIPGPGLLQRLGSVGIILAKLADTAIGVATSILLPLPLHARTGRIEHIFVLVLENRSFDHMLGFSLMSRDAAGGWRPADGVDASTGQPTTIDGPDPARHANDGHPVGPGALALMRDDPPHEFDPVRTQLCGAGGDYPHIDMSGFVASYTAVSPADPGMVMRGFTAEQLPCLSTLAREFAVCDRWFASMPGPTWPNRFFWHAASSGGLDDSPSGLRVATASFFDGYSFERGTIYDRLDEAGIDWAIYHGDLFPQALAIQGMDVRLAEGRFRQLDELAADVARPDLRPGYIFIEPSYGQVLPRPTFARGSSQHPIDDIAGGEHVIKQVYEAIRSSPHWEHSLLIISHDEHGGFYDHVPPPEAVAPGDRAIDPSVNHHGFDFTRLGVRVPAVVVSPLIPRGSVDHVVHDHTSLLATVERLYGLEPLTRRDGHAEDLTHLLSLATPRTDAPVTLPEPPAFATPAVPETLAPGAVGADRELTPVQVGFLQVALRRHLATSPPEERPGIRSQVTSLRTQDEAGRYVEAVAQRATDGPASAG